MEERDKPHTAMLPNCKWKLKKSWNSEENHQNHKTGQEINECGGQVLDPASSRTWQLYSGLWNLPTFVCPECPSIEAQRGHWAKLGEWMLDFTGEPKIERCQSSCIPKESCYYVWTSLKELKEPTQLTGAGDLERVLAADMEMSLQFAQLGFSLWSRVSSLCSFPSFWNTNAHPLPLYISTMWPVFIFFRGLQLRDCVEPQKRV